MTQPRILFHRDFVQYTGGHGKVWDYFNHALALGWDARVYLTPDSLRDGTNPWMRCMDRIESSWQPEGFDLLFLAGMDWAVLTDFVRPPLPVINLVQGVRHASQDHALYRFLPAPAHRICVSNAVAEAIAATDRVRGDISVIPAALTLPQQFDPAARPRDGVLIAGIKAPELAQEIGAMLRQRGVCVEVLDELIPRELYLSKVAQAQMLVALPHPIEGFYLPALEAMALGVPVVTADSVGSREYARDGYNCLLADLTAASLVAAIERLLDPVFAAGLVQGGRATANLHHPLHERTAFAEVLKSMRNSV